MDVAQPQLSTNAAGNTVTLTDALMTSDLTQLSVGMVDTRASSSVAMNGYDNFAALDRPIASSITTTIGNLGTNSAFVAP
jgi:hypothetical protein